MYQTNENAKVENVHKLEALRAQKEALKLQLEQKRKATKLKRVQIQRRRESGCYNNLELEAGKRKVIVKKHMIRALEVSEQVSRLVKQIP